LLKNYSSDYATLSQTTQLQQLIKQMRECNYNAIDINSIFWVFTTHPNAIFFYNYFHVDSH
jgi:hypothetical protein